MSNSSKKKRKKIVNIIIVVFVFCLIGGGLYYYFALLNNSASSEGKTYTKFVAQSGEIEDTVFGSGTISAASRPYTYAQTEGTVDILNVSIGDNVQAGDIVIKLENEDLDNEIRSIEYDIWGLDAQIAQLNESLSSESIKSPIAGRVMIVYGKQGDDALSVYRENGALAILSSDGCMKVEIECKDGNEISLGDIVNVKIEDKTVEGKVIESYMQNTRLTVIIYDDNLPYNNQAEVYSLNDELLGMGNLEVNNPLVISAFGGVISDVKIETGDYVSQSYTLFKLDNAPVTLDIQTLMLERTEKAEELSDAYDKRENLIIRAGVDGVIASLSIDEGNIVTLNQELLSIIEGEEMLLTLSVDELDVVDVQEGQPVYISVDAYPDLNINGTVKKIAPVGSGSNGVSSYEVELDFSAEDTGVMPGMNASGEIQTAYSDNAVYVPVEALITNNNKTFVMVESTIETSVAEDSKIQEENDNNIENTNISEEQENSSNTNKIGNGTENRNFDKSNMPANLSQEDMQANMAARRNSDSANNAVNPENTSSSVSQMNSENIMLVPVEVGIINTDYAQILSGISAGTTVLYQSEDVSSSTSVMNINSINRMMSPGMGK